MATKCRCHHGVPWFYVCPWCKSEANAAAYEAADLSLFPFWRNMTPQQAQEYVEHAAWYLRRHALTRGLDV